MITSPQDRIDGLREKGLWEGLCLHQLLDTCVSEAPDQLAVADPPNRAELLAGPPRRLTYRELSDASYALASDLLAQGIGEDDRVVVQLPNCVELVVCYMAISRIGAIIAPVAVQYGKHEVGKFCATLDASAYLGVAMFKGDEFGRLRAQELADTVSVLLFGKDLLLRCEPDRPARARVAALKDIAGDADRIFTVCWTSGTTGLPKGVPRSHNMWGAVGRNTAEAGGYRRGDVLLNAFPMVNMAAISAFLYAWVQERCTLILHHPFDPALFLSQMQNEKVNFTVVQPAILNQLAQDEALWRQFDFSSLRVIGSGSAPLSPAMMETFERDYGKSIVNCYGSNEGISLLSRPADVPAPSDRAYMFPRFGVEGLAWSSAASTRIETKVVDRESGETISASGVAGELAVRGATVFDGYWACDNAEVFTDDGYFLTGDLVEICGDSQQFYRIAGRCKDIINRGGMKLSPTEIDVLLEGLPGAREAAVCAYPDDILGEKVCACVVPVSDAQAPTLSDVVEFLNSKGMAKIKLPERLELMPSLPRNALGKVQRFELQKQVSGARGEQQ